MECNISCGNNSSFVLWQESMNQIIQCNVYSLSKWLSPSLACLDSSWSSVWTCLASRGDRCIVSLSLGLVQDYHCKDKLCIIIYVKGGTMEANWENHENCQECCWEDCLMGTPSVLEKHGLCTDIFCLQNKATNTIKMKRPTVLSMMVTNSA